LGIITARLQALYAGTGGYYERKRFEGALFREIAANYTALINYN